MGDVRVRDAGIDKLLLEHVDCFEKLEVLLLLHRHCGSVWTAKEVAERLGISQGLAAEALDALSSSHFLSNDATGAHFRYHPAAADDARIIGDLACTYERDPIRIIRTISQNALDRIRSSAITAFAQSFRIGRNSSTGRPR